MILPANPEMPVGSVSQPDTDITITAVMCQTEQAAFNEFKKMMPICAVLNNITNYKNRNCIETAVNYIYKNM